jgi:UDP-N-acetylglucosamine acyltransferase
VQIDISRGLDRLGYRYPSSLVDRIVEHEPGRRLVAVKNVTFNEDFFQGHFPGAPLMPGVMMIEALAQVATLLLMQPRDGLPAGRAFLRGVDDAKFRRQIVPGDQLRLEVTAGAQRGNLARASGVAYIGDTVVAEASLLFGLVADGAGGLREDVTMDPSAHVHPRARIGAGTVIGPNVIVGEHVAIGRNCRIGASTLVEGHTEIGDDNQIFPFVSIGLIPQDLKFGGQPTRITIGHHNVIREFVTIHKGTAGGGGITTVGDRNLLMAYTHIAHDCHVGNETIFANAATLAGHVLVEDYATVGAFSGVHQFCRVGRHAFIGGYSVVTKDALPFAKTVGNRARIYGLNTIGLVRRKFSPDSISKLKRVYRHLLHSNTSRALAQIEQDPTLDCPEVTYVVEFIRSSQRGVGLRRPSRRPDESVDE